MIVPIPEIITPGQKRAAELLAARMEAANWKLIAEQMVDERDSARSFAWICALWGALSWLGIGYIIWKVV